MATQARRNVLVMVDAENQNSDWARRAIEKATDLGCVKDIRAFGNFQVVDRGYAQLSLEYGVKCEQVFSLPRKNGCDISMCIFAIESAAAGGWDTLVLATGDADFAPLVQHLKRRGKAVVGVAERAHKSLSLACDEFVCTPIRPDDITAHVRHILQGPDDQTLLLSELGARLKHRDSSLIPKNYGFASLTKLLEASPGMFHLADKNTVGCTVRLAEGA